MAFVGKAYGACSGFTNIPGTVDFLRVQQTPQTLFGEDLAQAFSIKCPAGMARRLDGRHVDACDHRASHRLRNSLDASGRADG